MDDSKAEPLFIVMRAKGFSVRTLAAELKGEVSKSTIENILRGYRLATPDKPLDMQPATMQAIAKILGVEINSIEEFKEANKRAVSKEGRQPGVNQLAGDNKTAAMGKIAVALP